MRFTRTEKVVRAMLYLPAILASTNYFLPVEYPSTFQWLSSALSILLGLKLSALSVTTFGLELGAVSTLTLGFVAIEPLRLRLGTVRLGHGTPHGQITLGNKLTLEPVRAAQRRL